MISIIFGGSSLIITIFTITNPINLPALMAFFAAINFMYFYIPEISFSASIYYYDYGYYTWYNFVYFGIFNPLIDYEKYKIP